MQYEIILGMDKLRLNTQKACYIINVIMIVGIQALLRNETILYILVIVFEDFCYLSRTTNAHKVFREIPIKEIPMNI